MKRLPPHKVLWITYALFAAQIILLLIARLLTSVTAALAAIPLAVIMLVFHFLFYRCPHCGAYLGRNLPDGFCPRCGKKLGDSR